MNTTHDTVVGVYIVKTNFKVTAKATVMKQCQDLSFHSFSSPSPLRTAIYPRNGYLSPQDTSPEKHKIAFASMPYWLKL